ncbi:hypothetical protein QVD17_18178 [Tagetes erecta]|uniref:Uncharacterized protein n=1 Tax=Tagetes erecta TaxID=13708 RepID=A0AAD8KHM6_TARER|nr:hypothetical protein QVD17_18178 [Tagetes erecta]
MLRSLIMLVDWKTLKTGEKEQFKDVNFNYFSFKLILWLSINLSLETRHSSRVKELLKWASLDQKIRQRDSFL